MTITPRVDAGTREDFKKEQYKDFPTSELTDGIHPNDTNGYPRMANVWYAAIKSYLH